MKNHLVILLAFFYKTILSAELDESTEDEFRSFAFLISTKSRSCLRIVEIFSDKALDSNAKYEDVYGNLVEKFGSFIEPENGIEDPVIIDYMHTQKNVQEAFKNLKEEKLIDIVEYCLKYITKSFDLKKDITDALSNLQTTEIYKFPNEHKEKLMEISKKSSSFNLKFMLIGLVIDSIQRVDIMSHLIALFFVEEFIKNGASLNVKSMPRDITIQDVRELQSFFQTLSQKYEEASQNLQAFRKSVIPEILQSGEITLNNFSFDASSSQ